VITVVVVFASVIYPTIVIVYTPAAVGAAQLRTLIEASNYKNAVLCPASAYMS
jgi:hypothetical protein